MRKSVIAALTMGVLFAVAGVRAVEWWRLRDQTLNTANARAGSLALILSAYIRESFAAGDSALRQLTLHSRRIGGPDAADSEWAPSLASARAGLQDIGSITIVDARSIVRHSTQRAILGQSRRDQFMFRELAARDTDEFAVDTPFLTVIKPRQYLIPAGRE